MLKFYDVTGDPRSLRCILHELEDGMTLSAKVKETVNFVRGRFVVALPESIQLSPSLDFAETLYLRAESNYRPSVGSIIKTFVADPKHAVFLQDIIASTKDESFKNYRWRNRAFSYKDEVYWQLVGPETSGHEFEDVLDQGTLLPFSAFFYEQGPQDFKSVLNDTDLDEIVRSLVGIIVGAFDEDSFLIWWNGGAPLPVKVESP